MRTFIPTSSNYPTTGGEDVFVANFHLLSSIIAEFGTTGVWKWDGSAWSQETGSDPEFMLAADTEAYGDKELILDFGSLGLWHWDEDTWTQLSGINPDYMISDEVD